MPDSKGFNGVTVYISTSLKLVASVKYSKLSSPRSANENVVFSIGIPSTKTKGLKSGVTSPNLFVLKAGVTVTVVLPSVMK